jgi:hypothetical protein
MDASVSIPCIAFTSSAVMTFVRALQHTQSPMEVDEGGGRRGGGRRRRKRKRKRRNRRRSRIGGRT